MSEPTPTNTTEPAKVIPRPEKPFHLSLKAVFDFYTKYTHDLPMRAYQLLPRAVDKVTQNAMYGRAALVTMPLGIMARNGARVAYAGARDGVYAYGAGVAGVAGAAGAWWIAGNYALTQLTANLPVLTGTVGSIGAMIAAAVTSSIILPPAFAFGRMIGATMLGTAASAISIIPAVDNLGNALERTGHAWKGIKYDEETLKSLREPYTKGALTGVEEERRLQAAWNAVSHLTPDNREKIYKSLVTEFGKAEDGVDVPKKPRRGQTPQPPQL